MEVKNLAREIGPTESEGFEVLSLTMAGWIGPVRLGNL